MIYTVTLNPALDRELIVPALAHDTVLRATTSRADVGGKGFNVSRMVAALGGQSVALGFAGGKTGEMLQSKLDAAGIATDFTWIDGETRTNTSIVSAENGQYIKANESGPTISEAALSQLLAQVAALATPGDDWVLAGSLPPGVPVAIYGMLIETIQAAGGRVILDASGEALRLGLAARPFLAKPNDEEAMALTGAATPAEAADAVRAMGVHNVVVSLGKHGALICDSTGLTDIASIAITQKNPIGAGDAMVGGIVHSLSTGLPLPQAVRWGMACGAAAAAKYAFGTRA